MAEYLLSCDWGTSSFRIRLVSAPALHIIAETASGEGVLAVYNNWVAANDPDREAFYFEVLSKHIKALEKQSGIPLAGTPVVISGMASSTIGITELPYTDVPFAANGGTLNTSIIRQSARFPHDIMLISGAKSTDDVMRGEETQLVGCMDGELIDTTGYKRLIFPGTHSKHIFATNDEITGFKTYMTGEFFALLSEKSILKNSVQKNSSDEVSNSFKLGVKAAVQDNILHTAFTVRTNDLFDKLSKEENYEYLSGLLIGSELKDLEEETAQIFLCPNTNLKKFYSAAIEALGLSDKVTILPPHYVDHSVINGQYKIFKSKYTHNGK